MLDPARLQPACRRVLDAWQRRTLVLDELLRYSADLICLQEVDEKAFTRYLQPQLAAQGAQLSLQGLGFGVALKVVHERAFIRYLQPQLAAQGAHLAHLCACDALAGPLSSASPSWQHWVPGLLVCARKQGCPQPLAAARPAALVARLALGIQKPCQAGSSPPPHPPPGVCVQAVCMLGPRPTQKAPPTWADTCSGASS